MHVFIFQSKRNGRQFGFTADKVGGNLPGKFAPWLLVGDRDITPGQVLAGWGPSNAILSAVRDQGYSIVMAGEVSVEHKPLLPRPADAVLIALCVRQKAALATVQAARAFWTEPGEGYTEALEPQSEAFQRPKSGRKRVA
jgi:hypothetical protein